MSGLVSKMRACERRNARSAAGVPSSASTLSQQSGRAGRAGATHDSLAIIIANNSPLDQYYVLHPEELFKKRPEKVLIDKRTHTKITQNE